MMDKILFEKALDIASTYDVRTNIDSVVLFSISFLPTKENKIRAEEYVAENPDRILIDYTPCGKALIALDLEKYAQSDEDMKKIAQVWKVASKRFIEEASGNVTAFVDHADERSVFRSTELPEIIKNRKIVSINGIDKFRFKFQMGW